MPTYTLELEEDGFIEPRSIEFESEDGHEAFRILSSNEHLQKAKIYRNENLVGTIVKTAEADDGFPPHDGRIPGKLLHQLQHG